MSVTPLFHDRHAGGMALAQALSQHVRRPGTVVLGMARGGVAVAAPVARALDASLDTFVGRKLGVPGLEEVAFGAIAEGDEGPVLEGVHDYIGLPRRVVTTIVAHEREEMARRIRRYRDGHPLPSLAGRTVIVVDDGLASGATLTAAGRALRRHRPARLIAAVPVASTDGLQSARATFDEVVAVATPAPFGTVSDWYRDYDPVSDAEVRALLGRAPAPEHREHAAAPAGNERDVAIPSTEPGFTLVMPGELGMPPDARSPHGLVILAHGGGSSRGSYRNRYLAARLRLAGWATLRVDLLGERERDADTDGGCASTSHASRADSSLPRAGAWTMTLRVRITSSSSAPAPAPRRDRCRGCPPRSCPRRDREGRTCRPRRGSPRARAGAVAARRWKCRRGHPAPQP
ncbi:MAG: phosphoribosyltransferase [Gemmatimonadetes bacterium]|nr:phosphoribosyltransferase [Gemmatimonadota bacterium]